MFTPGVSGSYGSVLALGDSFSCGEGVGVQLDVGLTWAGVLARGMQADLDVLARAGATIGQVRETQLPIALGRPPSWVTLLAGLNDVFRTRFQVTQMRADLHEIVSALAARHRGVLLVKLHDPTAVLPLSGRLATLVRAKVDAVNRMVDEVVVPGVVVADLSCVPGLRLRGAWAVDRLHPSRFGHELIAAAAADSLAAAGTWPYASVAASSCDRTPTKIAEYRWVIRHGVPWVARRAPAVGNAVATLLAH